MKRTLIKLALLFTILMGCIQIAVIEHEQAHVQIQTYFGCVDGGYTVGWFQGLTTCYLYNNRTTQTRDAEYFLHGLNEVVTYNIFALIISAFMILGYVTVTKFT